MCALKYIYFVFLLSAYGIRCNGFSNMTPDKSYSASTEELKKLLEVEDELAENLSGYLEQLKKKLNLVEQSLTNMQAEHNLMMEDYETHLGNPLNSFHLTYRLHISWRKWFEYTSNAQANELEHIEKAHRMRAKLPTFLDLDKASRGIDGLMYFYDLKPEDLAAGNLSGFLQPETALSSQDCFAMAEFSIKERKHELAQIWFNVSLATFKENNSIYEVCEFNKYAIHNSWGALLMSNKQNDEGLFHLRQEPMGEQSFLAKEFYEDILTIQRNCTAEYQRPTHLHCRYNFTTTPFLRIAPLKMEELSTDPYMVAYHDVIYESEINWLLNESAFHISLVADSQFSPDRTSKDSNNFDEDSNVVKAIDRRVTDLTGLSLDRSDPYSLINYGLGGHYLIHDDFHRYSQKNRLFLGERIVTVLFYLGEVDQGGNTIFPALNISVTPKKGSAVMWYNLHNSGDFNYEAMHSACPVIVGSKYVLTKWINEIPQTFVTPCMKEKW
ncbi:hypothetical protein KR009_001519 [Drosophila setifemur]|nr:hypothetical protein KR009_001519 [Drosophila setifemur]